MNDIIRNTIIQPIIDIISFPLLRNVNSSNLIVFYYHLINDEDVPHIQNLYKYKRTEQFSDDLDFLLENYSPIGLADVILSAKGKVTLPKNSFMLSFDDGFSEIYDIIAPILLDKGIPATFFISSAFLDNQELCYQNKASLLIEKIRKGISRESEVASRNILMNNDINYADLTEGLLKIDYRRREILDSIGDILMVDFKKYLLEKQPYLNSSKIRELIDQGFTIGAHSIDHPYYSAISLDEQIRQTIGSVKDIRQKFDLDYGAFAFPHNDAGVSSEFFKIIQESGLIDITFGTGGTIDDEIQSHRQRMSLEKPLMPAGALIAWQNVRRMYKKLLGIGKGGKDIVTTTKSGN